MGFFDRIGPFELGGAGLAHRLVLHVAAGSGDLGDKAGDAIAHRLSKDHALRGVGDVELLFGAGDADVGEPPLLLNLVGVVDRLHAGEDALLRAAEKDVVKLQTLCRVHGHHDDPVGIFVVVVEVGVEGDLLQESRQSGQHNLRLLVGVVRVDGRLWNLLGLLNVLEDVGLELTDVLDAGDPFLPQRLQVDHVAGLLQQLVEQLLQVAALRQLAKALDHLCKLHQLMAALGKRLVLVGVGQHLKQRQAQHVGDLLRLVDGGVADAALWLVDDAAQADRIGVVIDDAHVGDDVLDLLAVVEALAADDAVGDAGADQRILDGVGLGVHPVEDGVVGKFLSLCHVVQNGVGDKARLVLLVECAVDLDRCPLRVLGPQRLALALGVVFDDGVGRVQDGLGAAVVLLQADDLGVAVLVFKV